MPSSADSTAAMPILTQIQFIANQPRLMARCRPTSQLRAMAGVVTNRVQRRSAPSILRSLGASPSCGWDVSKNSDTNSEPHSHAATAAT